MAKVYEVRHKELVTQVTQVTITHNLDSDMVSAAFIDSEGNKRTDLIDTIILDENDPKNSLQITFSQEVTGRIQLSVSDERWATMPDANLMKNTEKFISTGEGANVINIFDLDFTGLDSDQIIVGDGNDSIVPLARSVFGSEKRVFKSYSVETSTLTTYVDKINETFTVPQGKYFITVRYDWNYNSGSRDFQAEVGLATNSQSEVVIFEQRQEPQDTSGTFLSTGSDQKYNNSFSDEFELNGSTTIALRWKSAQNRVSASMWNASIILWRTE